jgi:hypothetical protein
MAVRLIGLLALALAAMVLPASAQGWREFSYPNAGFAVQLPAEPVMETGTYTLTGGIAAPATIYAHREPNMIYTMTIADLTGTAADNAGVIDQTVRALRQTGEVTVDVRSEINDQYGRQLSIDDSDGSRSIYGIFYINHRLYELKAEVLPPNPERRSGFAIRFQQSLRFIVPRGGRRN